jgi:hypothetical protein
VGRGNHHVEGVVQTEVLERRRHAGRHAAPHAAPLDGEPDPQPVAPPPATAVAGERAGPRAAAERLKNRVAGGSGAVVFVGVGEPRGGGPGGVLVDGGKRVMRYCIRSI